VSPSEVKNLEISFLKPEDLKMYIWAPSQIKSRQL
jgi:hypothetical protein